MKFQKSERRVFTPNYNPPCNAYQTDCHAVAKKIMTGSLAVPCLGNRNTFGYGERFENKNLSGPGPASYTVDVRSKSLVNLLGREKISMGRIKNNDSKPSIPYSYYGQNEGDQEEQAYIKYIHLNEDIPSSHKAIQKKEPAFTFPKCARSKPETKEIILEEEETLFQKVEEKEALRAKKMSCVIQSKIKESSDHRLHAIQALEPDFVPSLELIEIIKKKKNSQMPGPGAYLKEQEENIEFQFYQNPKGASFTSMKRFQSDTPSLVGPGLYDPKPDEKTKKFSFSRSNRNVLFEKKETSNFRFYINPEKNQELDKNQERASSCPFGSTASRFPQSLNNQEPALTLKEEIERTKNTKMNKIIQQKLKLHRKENQNEKDGLLGISTMASTID